MKDDTRWLAESPLADFLHFSDKSDPFFVVPSCKEPHTPSNPMTATLQAKLRAKQRCGAQLPLQAPLLRRIRKAELVIMKESMQARHFHWPPEQIGERSSERVRAGKRAAKFIACTVCEQVVQSNFPKPHEVENIRKTFSSEELQERHDAGKGSCAMKRLAQLFKRQKLEVNALPDGTAEMRAAKSEPFYEEINKSELAFHWKSFALQHACSEVFRSDADDVHRVMQQEFERLTHDLPHERDDEVQDLLRRAARLAVSDERRKKTRPASPAPHFGAKATPAAANDTSTVSTAYRPVHQVAYAEAEVKSSESLAPRPKPAKVEKIDLGAYSALPWNVSDSTAQELFEKYIERVPEALVQNTDTWQALETSLKGSNMDPRPVRGPYALEFFWLKSRAPDSDGKAPNAETAEGLCVFQLQRSGGKPVGQLRHFSVISMDIFEDALTSVKNLMFTRLPIMSIRYVIWCREKGEDGKLKANNEVEDVLKSLCFRWFRFENNRGVRGKEMNRPRGENDPTLPLEVPSLEICLGQVWLRGANANSKAVAYTGNLALAAGVQFPLMDGTMLLPT
eukprot:symbB.v1.2.000005.t1/scaffold5.1/size591573/5